MNPHPTTQNQRTIKYVGADAYIRPPDKLNVYWDDVGIVPYNIMMHVDVNL